MNNKRYRHYLKVIFSFYLAGFFSWGNYEPAQAEQGWSTPEKLSSAMQHAWFPDIVADVAGGIHVVYLGSDLYKTKNTPLWEKYDNLYYQHITPDGKPVGSEPSNIAVSPFGVVARSAIGADNARGLLHLLVRSNHSLHYQNVPITSAAVPLAWSGLANIDGNQLSYYSAIAIDSQGTLHAVWSQVVGKTVDKFHSALVYRKSSNLGKSWSFPKVIVVPKFGVSRVELKIDRRDRLHLSWDDGYDNQTGKFEATFAGYSNSTDSGNNWSAPLIYGNEKEPVVQTTMTPFGENQVMLVWRVIKKQKIYFVVSHNNGQSWSEPAEVPGITARVFTAQHFFDRYYLAGDFKGRVHLAAVGMSDRKKELVEKESDLALYHSVWDNERWTSLEQVGGFSGFPEYPRLAIGLERIHLVWFTRNKLTDEDSKTIWYSHLKYDTGLKPQALGSYRPPAPTVPPMAVTPVATTAAEPARPQIEEPATSPWLEQSYTNFVLALLPVLAIGLLSITYLKIKRHRSNK